MFKYLIISKNNEPFYVDVVIKNLTKQQKENINFFKKVYNQHKITTKITKKNIFLEW
jgi:hypothetical protein